MKCPYCNFEDSKVIDKRDAEAQNATRRRRECLKCQKRFTTYERIEAVELVIIKKDGRREPFSMQKLVAGLTKACEKRPISSQRINSVAEKIEAELRRRNSTEIPSKVIGELVMKKLKSLDKVAYIRFASVYREFADLDDFRKELKKLIKK